MINVKKNNKGFTLLELLAVIVIIATLATMAIIVFGNKSDRAKQIAHNTNVKYLESEGQEYILSQNTTPIGDITNALVSSGLIKEIPQNPLKTGNYQVFANANGTITVTPSTVGTIPVGYTANLCISPSKASTLFGSAVNPNLAFDNTPDTVDYASSSARITNEGLVIYDFGAGTPKRIERYSIKAHNRNMQYSPRSWEIYGSNDDDGWVFLGSKTDESQFSPLERRYYTFSNTDSYRYYAILITKSYDGTGGTGKITYINELEFMEGIYTLQ